LALKVLAAMTDTKQVGVNIENENSPYWSLRGSAVRVRNRT
jgi:hypothetical protein